MRRTRTGPGPPSARRRAKVDGAVVAVTGAAKGIGLDVARRLSRAGALVALGDLDGDAAVVAAGRVGRSARGSPLDVTDPASFRAFLDDTERELGPIDVLVNNAGVMWVGPLAEEPEEAARRQIDVNLFGAIRGVKLAAPRMVNRGRGHIVTVASAASKLSPVGEATYAATKHGIYGYLKSARAELRGTGVVISVIMPTVVDTELALGTATGPVRRLRPAAVSDAVARTIERPRFETAVPGRVAALDRIVTVLPQYPRDVILRWAVPDQLVATRDRSARNRYDSTVSW